MSHGFNILNEEEFFNEKERLKEKVLNILEGYGDSSLINNEGAYISREIDLMFSRIFPFPKNEVLEHHNDWKQSNE